uniref:Uncharacterized protein n=1 Tax=Steinernema glaseri TaxID=37863 RepID=A0A1I7ZGV0_9BILA
MFYLQRTKIDTSITKVDRTWDRTGPSHAVTAMDPRNHMQGIDGYKKQDGRRSCLRCLGTSRNRHNDAKEDET